MFLVVADGFVFVALDLDEATWCPFCDGRMPLLHIARGLDKLYRGRPREC